jgi:hypothetical protein
LYQSARRVIKLTVVIIRGYHCYQLHTIFKLVWWGVESNWVHSALRPLRGLLCQPRVIMMIEKLVEWLAGETEVLGENLPQCRFVHHKPHMLPGHEPEPPRWEASD